MDAGDACNSFNSLTFCVVYFTGNHNARTNLVRITLLNNRLIIIGFSLLVQELINSLKCLPGVGAKSAQRMTFYLLERNRIGGLNYLAF